jgi:hypothetical protein
MSIIIRDFAYPPNDQRFHGDYPKAFQNSVKEPDDDEDVENGDNSDEEAGIDFSLWEWMWFYNNVKSRSKPSNNVLY